MKELKAAIRATSDGWTSFFVALSDFKASDP